MTCAVRDGDWRNWDVGFDTVLIVESSGRQPFHGSNVMLLSLLTCNAERA